MLPTSNYGNENVKKKDIFCSGKMQMSEIKFTYLSPIFISIKINYDDKIIKIISKIQTPKNSHNERRKCSLPKHSIQATYSLCEQNYLSTLYTPRNKNQVLTIC
jgi:hypothetical protein